VGWRWLSVGFEALEPVVSLPHASSTHPAVRSNPQDLLTTHQVHPAWSTTNTFAAQLLANSRTHLRCPRFAARCSGVRPAASRALTVRLRDSRAGPGSMLQPSPAAACAARHSAISARAAATKGSMTALMTAVRGGGREGGWVGACEVGGWFVGMRSTTPLLLGGLQHCCCKSPTREGVLPPQTHAP